MKALRQYGLPRLTASRWIGQSGGAGWGRHLSHMWLAWMREETRDHRAYLVPLRVFIGIGWLRTFAEKLADPGWPDGSSLSSFLGNHLQSGHIDFPFYESLITQIFLPHAAALSPLIMLGELLTGLAILAGCFTNAALLGGLFMNFSILLAGAPNPSTFYIVIQIALLVTNAGAILGVDRGLARTVRSLLVVA